MSNPFARKPPNKKSGKERRVRDREKLYGEAKTQRRREIFERSKGFCEALRPWEFEPMIMARCAAPITLETMEWSHKRHGSAKDDSLDGGIASCKDCHRAQHNWSGPPMKRRPGKIMKISDAREYWAGKICFCDGPKSERESFCPVCNLKLSKQTLFDLENADDPDTYREALARGENEVLLG